MNTYIVVFLSLAALVTADYSYHSIDDQHYQAPAPYSYQYKVHDAHTGDVKSHHESREGDAVKGYYTLKEADGTTREVHYTADKHNGFQAVVKKSGHPQYHEPQTQHYSHQPEHQGYSQQAQPHHSANVGPAAYAHSAIHPHHGSSHQTVHFY